MKLSEFAVKNPVTTVMMMFLVILLGFVSLTNLRLDLMPNITPPVLAVLTSYPGAGPEEIAEIVTKPLEESIGISQGIKKLQSRSIPDTSLVIAQFEWGTNISEVREDLSARIDRINLPDGVTRPMVVKFDPTLLPIIEFTVSNSGDLSKLLQTVNKHIAPKLRSVEGVASVSVTGGFQEEIMVSLNRDALAKYRLTQETIVRLLRANNITMPGGYVLNDDEKLNLRIISSIKSIETLKELPLSVVPQAGGIRTVSLSDVAEINYQKTDITSAARTNGKKSIMVSILKKGTANTAEVSRSVRDKLNEIKTDYHDLSFSIFSNQGEIIEKSVSNVASALIFGGLFATLVILVFLRSFFSTLIVAIAIPFSVITTFVLMYFSGITLNIMSLGGLALGVGMLVDNSIVVIENINRHLTLAKTKRAAVIEGAGQVAAPVASSTLTTLSVFLPVVFVGGMVGDLFKELAWTVSFSLLASLLVSLTVVPSLAAILLKPSRIKQPKNNIRYRRLLIWALNHRLLTLLLAAALFAGSLTMIPKIGTEFLPTQDESVFVVDIKMPEGSTLQKTLESAGQIEKKALLLKEIKVVTTSAGIGDPMMSFRGGGENTATVTVKLVPRSRRSRTTEEVMRDLAAKLEPGPPDASLSFNLSSSMQAMSGAPSAVEVLVRGAKASEVAKITNELTKHFKAVEGVKSVDESTEYGRPEFQYILDHNKAARYGITAQQAAVFINLSVQGTIATKISVTGAEKNVRVRINEVQSSVESIESMKIPSPLGQDVALGEIGHIERGTGPAAIIREEGMDVVTISALFEGYDLGTMTARIQNQINQVIKDMDIDTDLYSIRTTGGAEIMGDSFKDLRQALILAIIFVYMIMASQFESLLQPFIILLTLPLAIIGITSSLIITGYSFGITAFIGIIILAGIVVNNAIILVDFANQLSRNGMSTREAIVNAGATRLRPILMTALTTILGLLPLALGTGEGTELQAPMAVTVIGGLLTSTLLTLIIIPVAYSMVGGLRR